jgi:hypothetical protein
MGNWLYHAGQDMIRENGKFEVKHEGGVAHFTNYYEALFFYSCLPPYGGKAIWDLTKLPELIMCHYWDDDAPFDPKQW